MEGLQDFWRLVVEVWQHGFLGVDISRLLIALGVFVGFLLVRRLFTHIVIGRLKAWSARSKTRIDDRAIAALESPVRFVPLVMGAFFALRFLDLNGLLADISDNLVRSLVAFNIFWALHNLVDPFSLMFGRLEKIFSHAMVEWLVKAIKVAVIFIGGATVLEIWGIQVAPLIAGLGLFGVAVALGAQDLFKNLISGILILGEKRFGIGDWIRVDGVVEGTVESIGFRSTRIRRFDKAPVHVPNVKLADQAVTNVSGMTHRRIYWTIGLEYRTTIEQLRQVRDQIEAYVLESSEFAKPTEVATFVRVDSFNDSSIDLLLYCFTVTTNWGEWLEIKERLAYRIKEIVETAETSFAFPSQSLYVESLPSERPEPFTPPAAPSAQSPVRESEGQ